MGQAETPSRPQEHADLTDTAFSPSIASSVVATRGGGGSGGGGLEHQLGVLQKLHSSGLLDSEVFARQQDALLNDWRHANPAAGSVFDGGASEELTSHCQRYSAKPTRPNRCQALPHLARFPQRLISCACHAISLVLCRLRAALEQRLASAKSRQLDYAASKEAAAKLEASVAAEAEAHREVIAGVFRDGRAALQGKEQELLREVELRRDSALHCLAAQQEELVDSLAQHSESAALIRTALREDDARSFLAGYAQLCARVETEEAIAESLYEARATAAHANRWSIPDDLVPGTVDAAAAAAAAVGFAKQSDRVPAALLDRWAPPPVISTDEAPETPQRYSEEATVRRLAAEGDAESLYTLGGWLHKGTGDIPIDTADAETHYRKAAAQGHPEAACALGCMLIQPLVEPGSRHQRMHSAGLLAEALALLRQAAEAGVLEAHYNLGWILSGGLEIDGEEIRDVEQAIEHYRVAALGGDGMSKLSLGNVLAESMTAAAESGGDGSSDARIRWAEAIDWWKQALEDAEVSAEAAFRLGHACEREAEMIAGGTGGAGSKADGSITPDDTRLVSAGMQQALSYYHQAEGSGHPLAGREIARLSQAWPPVS